jgi:hypothetical protein
MIHGFDIPLEEPETFSSAAERSRTMLSSLGLELIPMATNYRALVADWSHSFGAAIGSCMMLFSGRFRVGLFGQGLTYNEFCLLHEGSNPLTDPLLSSDGFRVAPDGTAFDRASKILAMRNWDEFLRNLRVCWIGPQKDRNCCKCEKCIRNILTFRALGLGLPACFPEDVPDSGVGTLGLGPGALPEIRYGGLARLAAVHGVEGKWVGILEERLKLIKSLDRPRLLRYLCNPRYYFFRLCSKLSGRG